MEDEKTEFASEIHHRVVRKFPRRKVIVHRLDEVWGMDLASMESIASHNNEYKFILCIIDVFSKYAWCVPLKNKNATTVLDAVKEVITKSGRSPEKIWVDKGSEFYNKSFKDWAESNDIIIYSTYGDSKSCVVERFIRTLRDLITKKFTASQSYAWVKMLPSILNYYNRKYHKSVEMSPTDASDPTNSLQVFLIHQSKKGKRTKKPKFHIGDQVRISRIKGTFEKGSEANFTYEIFTVDQILKTEPVTYKLIDYNNEPIEGSFYNEELLKTKVPDYHLIEKIIKTRRVGKKKELLVKYKGHSDKFNQWITESQMKDFE